MNRKAVIFGIKGYKLTIKEKKFLFKSKPWGIILFSRNIKDITQLKKQCNKIKIGIIHPTDLNIDGRKKNKNR